MEQHDLLNKQLDGVKTQLSDAAQQQDTSAIRTLNTQAKELQDKLDASSKQIESLGGTTLKPEDLETQHQANLSALDSKISSAHKKLIDATTGGDYDAVTQHATALDELKAQREQQIQDFTQRVKALKESKIT
jgi:predicted  nucleic acid-binding Zn-ribbon protein